MFYEKAILKSFVTFVGMDLQFYWNYGKCFLAYFSKIYQGRYSKEKWLLLVIP